MSTVPFDWLDYPQQLELLWRFRCPVKRADIESIQGLETNLGEPVKDAIARFIQCDLIEKASLAGMLSMRFDAYQLKDICKNQGIKRSGSRGILAERLASEKPDEMWMLFQNEEWMECTPNGHTLLNRWKAAEEAKLEIELADREKTRIQEMKDAGITKVEFIGSRDPDECDICQSLDGKIFDIDSVPALPPPGCTCKPKCRAILGAHS